jgi:predicted 2-oxoglutarate/Fe(II)-dependent dioxygenase YbiX
MVEVTPGIYVVRAFSAEEAAAVTGTLAATSAWHEADEAAEVLHADARPELIALCRDRLSAATGRIASALAPKTGLAEIQLVRYRTGGRAVEHHNRPTRDATSRALSLVCFLNDDFGGGATAFPAREFTLQPWCGMAVVFAPDMPHGAEPVTEGTKYAVTAWYHLPPVRRTLAAEVQAEHELWETVLQEEHTGHQAVCEIRA